MLIFSVLFQFQDVPENLPYLRQPIKQKSSSGYSSRGRGTCDGKLTVRTRNLLVRGSILNGIDWLSCHRGYFSRAEEHAWWWLPSLAQASGMSPALSRCCCAAVSQDLTWVCGLVNLSRLLCQWTC